MFEYLGDQRIQLEHLGSVQTAAATHLRFRVVREADVDATSSG
jgi:hypothetical protein